MTSFLLCSTTRCLFKTPLILATLLLGSCLAVGPEPQDGCYSQEPSDLSFEGVLLSEQHDHNGLSLLQRNALLSTKKSAPPNLAISIAQTGDTASTQSLLSLSPAILVVILPVLLIAIVPQMPDAAQPKGTPTSLFPQSSQNRRALLASGAMLMAVVANTTSVVTITADVFPRVEQHTLLCLYALGLSFGLVYFTAFTVNSLWIAYRVSACVMLISNLSLAVASGLQWEVLWSVSHLGIGFECACAYNAGLALVHFSEPGMISGVALLAGIFVSVGFLLGPVLAAFGTFSGHFLGTSFHLEILLPLTSMSALGGLLLASLFFLKPPSLPQHVAQNSLEQLGRTLEKLGQDQHGRLAQLALVCTHWNFVLISTVQCLILQSLGMFLLERVWSWSHVEAALFIGNAVSVNVIVFVLFLYFVAGRVRDGMILTVLEMLQIVAVLGIALGPEPGRSVSACLLLHFLATTLHAAYCQAFCFSRAIQNMVTESLMVAGILALAAGIGLGIFTCYRISSNVKMLTSVLLILCLIQSLTLALCGRAARLWEGCTLKEDSA